MSQFEVNPHRLDPYKIFKFRVRMEGRPILGVCKVSGLKKTTEVLSIREGKDSSTPHRSPGQTVFEPIILVRGRTHDTTFEDWSNQVWRQGSGLGSESALSSFRKDITIELLNEAGQLVMAFKVYRCWPSEYIALDNLDANESCFAFESITLQHEGWERDRSIPELKEPSSSGPD